MSTIKDVARKTGLSIATISKYLNGGNVLEQNRARIDDAVRELGYRANRHAQSLKTNRTHTIGVVMPTLSIPFFGSVYSALDRVLREAGYTCLAASYDFDRELELEKIRMFANNDVDAIVLVPEAISAEELSAVTENASRDIPILLIDRIMSDFACDNVVVDNLNATYDAVEYLVTQGHKRIGIINGPLHISTAYERFVGYRRVLEDYGIALDDTPRSAGEYGNEPDNLVQIGNYDFESGYRLFNEFLRMDDPPTALCVTNYDMTVGAITAAHEQSIVLGRDMGFVGFDAVMVASVISPQLPVVEQPTMQMGQKAGELLLRRLSGDAEGYPQLLRLKTKFHIPAEKTEKGRI